MQAIQLAVKSNVSTALQACGLALHARTPLTKRIDYSVILTVAASDGKGQFVAVDGNPWPVQFDDEMRTCVRKAFTTTTFASASAFSLKATYPMCLRLDDADVEGAPDEHERAADASMTAAPSPPRTPPKSIRPAECREAAYGEGATPFAEQFKSMKPRAGWSSSRESEIRQYLDRLPVKPQLQVLQCKCPCCIVGVACETAAQCDDWMLKAQMNGRPPHAVEWRFISTPPAPEYNFTPDEKHIAAYVCY